MIYIGLICLDQWQSYLESLSRCHLAKTCYIYDQCSFYLLKIANSNLFLHLDRLKYALLFCIFNIFLLFCREMVIYKNDKLQSRLSLNLCLVNALLIATNDRITVCIFHSFASSYIISSEIETLPHKLSILKKCIFITKELMVSNFC